MGTTNQVVSCSLEAKSSLPSAFGTLRGQAVDRRYKPESASAREESGLRYLAGVGMTVRTSATLDKTFSSLADPTRRAIVERLIREHEVSVGDLAAGFDASLPSVIKHIDVLEGAGLVARRRSGRHVCCSLRADPMADAQAWLERHLRFWSASLDRLAAVVEEPSGKRSAARRSGRNARGKS